MKLEIHAIRILQFFIITIITISIPLPSISQEIIECNKETTLAIANGVWTTPFDAMKNMAELEQLFGPKYNNRSVRYELLKNSTIGMTPLMDIVETFRQRADELDPSGTISQDMTWFWEISRGYRDLTNPIVTRSNAAETIYRTIAAKIIETQTLTTHLMINDITQLDYQENTEIIDKSISYRNNILLIGHSQGSLFVNKLHKYISDKKISNTFNSTYFAPAATYTPVGSSYVLSDNDHVIDSLRIVAGDVLEPNIRGVPPTDGDFFNHSFRKTYLNPLLFPAQGSESMRTLAYKAITQAIDRLSPIPCKSSYKYEGMEFNRKRTNTIFQNGHFEGTITFDKDVSQFTGELNLSDVTEFSMTIPEAGKFIKYTSQNPCEMNFYMQMIAGRPSFWIIDSNSSKANSCSSYNTSMLMYGNPSSTSDEYYDDRDSPKFSGLYIGPLNKGWSKTEIN